MDVARDATYQRQNVPHRQRLMNCRRLHEKRSRALRPGESNREASRLGDVGSWGSRVSTRSAETARVEDL